MIKLFQFAPCWDLPNASPFCMKVETFLKMAGLPYETVLLSDPRKGPKGKLPYIEDDGQTVSDSSWIIASLTTKYDLKIDAELTDSQTVLTLALQRLMEEHLYWVIVYSRWIEAKGWDLIKATYFASPPKPLQKIIPALIRRGVRQALFGQGMGRHTREEIYSFGLQDLEALKIQLENNEFLVSSDKPTTIDATGYAFIANVLYAPVACPIQDYVRQYDCFARYCKKMAELYFCKTADCV